VAPGLLKLLMFLCSESECQYRVMHNSVGMFGHQSIIRTPEMSTATKSRLLVKNMAYGLTGYHPGEAARLVNADGKVIGIVQEKDPNVAASNAIPISFLAGFFSLLRSCKITFHPFRHKRKLTGLMMT